MAHLKFLVEANPSAYATLAQWFFHEKVKCQGQRSRLDHAPRELCGVRERSEVTRRPRPTSIWIWVNLSLPVCITMESSRSI